jgi:hypothetical protein
LSSQSILGFDNRRAHNEHHLPTQFNTKFYGAIESLREKRNINTILHVKDVHVQTDGMDVPSQEQDAKDFTTLQTSLL